MQETSARMISRVLDSKLELEELLRLVLGLIVEATHAERGFLVLLQPGGDYVRELKHVVERARVLAGGPVLGPGSIDLDPVPDRVEEIGDLDLLVRFPELTVRHLRMLGYVRVKKAVDAREAADAAGVSRATALRDLGKLLELGLVRKLGQGRAIRYIAGPAEPKTIFDPAD